MLNASFELGRLLREAGHRVTYLSHADVGSRVEAEGFEFFELSEDRELVSSAQADPAPAAWNVVALAGWLGRRRRIRSASARNDEIERTIRELRADLVLIDPELHFAIIATSHLDIPIAIPTVFFSLHRHKDVPPLDSDIVPDNEVSTRKRIRNAWESTLRDARKRDIRLRFGPSLLKRWIRPIRYDTMIPADLEKVADTRGIRLQDLVDKNQWLRPFVYRRIPILHQHAWEMEFPHDPKPNVHYIGPMVHLQRKEPDADTPDLALWHEVKRQRTEAESSKPLVYCSFGSYFAGDVSLLNRVIEVFKKRQDWQLVVGLGSVINREKLEPVSDNVFLLDWAPQLDILQEADVSITHGGSSTISECAYMGVPMLLYPTSFVDHAGNSARVVYHGLGLRGNPDTDSADDIEQSIHVALTDNELLNRVSIMREVLRNYEAKEVAVKVVESLLDSEAGL